MRILTIPLSCSEIAAAVFLTEKEEGMVLYACKFAICWRASCECGRILWDHVSYTHLDTHPHPHAAGNSLRPASPHRPPPFASAPPHPDSEY